jgi:hypothetical protein
MTRGTLSAREFDSFSTAAGSSLISGALSVVAPFLTALTVTLVALAVAGWVALLRQRRFPARDLVHPSRLAALATLASGATFFLLPVSFTVDLRGLALATTLVPLWLVERGRPRGLPTPREGA